MRLMPAALAVLATFALNAEVQKPKPNAPAQAPKDPKQAKQKDILTLLRILDWPATNSEAARKQLDAAAKDPKAAGMPAAYWKEFHSAAMPDAFEKILIPIFDKAYTHDEVKSLIKLMNTPEFRLFLEKNPETKLKKEAFDGYSKYMTEVGAKLREKHTAKAPAAPVKK